MTTTTTTTLPTALTTRARRVELLLEDRRMDSVVRHSWLTEETHDLLWDLDRDELVGEWLTVADLLRWTVL